MCVVQLTWDTCKPQNTQLHHSTTTKAQDIYVCVKVKLSFLRDSHSTKVSPPTWVMLIIFLKSHKIIAGKDYVSNYGLFYSLKQLNK